MKSGDEATSSLSRLLLIVIIAVIAVAAAISIALALYISGMISKPLKVLTDFMKLAGTNGDITISTEKQANFNKYSHYKDEIGQCISSTVNFIKHITVISKDLEAIVDCDLRVDIKLLSEKDGMGLSMKKMVETLNGMFSDIQVSTTHVAEASKQVADDSQTLAHGSTEQAAIVEQLSSSVTEISCKTKENAEMTGKAASLANTIKSSAEKACADRTLRPLARRRAKTLRPLRVDMRLRKPCSLERWRFLG